VDIATRAVVVHERLSPSSRGEVGLLHFGLSAIAFNTHVDGSNMLSKSQDLNKNVERRGVCSRLACVSAGYGLWTSYLLISICVLPGLE